MWINKIKEINELEENRCVSGRQKTVCAMRIELKLISWFFLKRN